MSSAHTSQTLCVRFTQCSHPVFQSFLGSLLRLAVRGFPRPLRILELLDLALHRLIQPRLQLRSVPEEEEDLEPDEEGREEECLHEIVQQSRSTALELAVPDELCDPGNYVHPDRGVIGGRAVGLCEIVGVGGAGDEEGSEEATRDRFHENVEGRVQDRGDGSDVEREGFGGQDWWKGNRWRVRTLAGLVSCRTTVEGVPYKHEGRQQNQRHTGDVNSDVDLFLQSIHVV